MRYLLATAIMLVLLYLTFWLIAALQSSWAVLLAFSFMFGLFVTPQVDKLLARFEK